MITFQDKVSINTDPSIPEINKITDQNINDLKAGINTNETNINDLKKLTFFSTDELQTGEKWIDGNLNVVNQNSRTRTFFITLKYTKTTDVAS